MKTYSRICAEVNLDAIATNIERMKNNLSKEMQMIAVIKADGYGHGAVPIAKVLEQYDYIWGFAVATLDEALVLKKQGVTKNILVLGCVFPEQYLEMLRNDIRACVYTETMAQDISALAEKEGLTAYMHIKIDTGMGRLGFPVTTDSVNAIHRISGLKNVCLEGIFTHFSKADETDKTFTQKQIKDFTKMITELKNIGVDFPYRHCSNSAAIIDVPCENCNIVRAGISTYGLYPSEEVCKSNVELTPALSLHSKVAYVKEVSAGTPISYGGTFVTDKCMKIATIPVGYADGYPRTLSNKGYVLIHGKKAPVVGRICMDQFMVDVTEIEDVRFGDKVTLIGRDGDAVITVEELGDLSNRFNYEFVCDLTKRIPRNYIRNGKLVEQIDWF